MGDPYIHTEPYDPKYREGVLAVAHEVHEASIFNTHPLDETRLIAQIEDMSKFGSTYFVRVAVREGHVYGGMIGVLQTTFFSGQQFASDVGWWVRRTRQGTAAAGLLLGEFERWAKWKGADLVLLGQSSGIDVEKTVKLYQHAGYTIVGANGAKRL